MVVVFQTLFGRFGLGKLNEERGVIEKCIGIHVAMTQQGGKINLIPMFDPFSKELPDIELHKILTYAKVTPDFERAYIEATTNIKIASNEREVIEIADKLGKFRSSN